MLRADDVNLVTGAKFEQAIGGRVRGQVQSESPTEVVVQLGANTTKVPTELIQSIRYDGQSASFALGEARESAGQLAEAAELFKKAAAESAGKPYPLQAALFREAEVLTDLAPSSPTASRTPRTSSRSSCEPTRRAATPSGRGPAWRAFSWPPAISRRRGRHRRAGQASQGRRARGGAAHQAPGQAEQAQGSDRRARQADRRFPKGSERLRAAQLAKAESLAGLKEFTKAETLLREVIKATPPEDAAGQAPAYNTLGDCLRAANRPKDALLAYLHTDLLYSKDKEEHPRALHQISLIFRQLKQDGRADEFAQPLENRIPSQPLGNRQGRRGLTKGGSGTSPGPSIRRQRAHAASLEAFEDALLAGIGSAQTVARALVSTGIPSIRLTVRAACGNRSDVVRTRKSTNPTMRSTSLRSDSRRPPGDRSHLVSAAIPSSE